MAIQKAHPGLLGPSVPWQPTPPSVRVIRLVGEQHDG
jgi:hypothetical protein